MEISISPDISFGSSSSRSRESFWFSCKFPIIIENIGLVMASNAFISSEEGSGNSNCINLFDKDEELRFPPSEQL